MELRSEVEVHGWGSREEVVAARWPLLEAMARDKAGQGGGDAIDLGGEVVFDMVLLCCSGRARRGHRASVVVPPPSPRGRGCWRRRSGSVGPNLGYRAVTQSVCRELA